MKWHFDNDRAIYLQIMEQITLAVISGEFAAGEKIPSVRELSKDAGVNPNTMQKALSELEEDGLLYTSRTYGRFVTVDTEKIAQEKEKNALNLAFDFVSKMKSIGMTKEEAEKILEKTGW